MNILKLDTRSADFNEQLAARLAWDESTDDNVESIVRNIIADVRKRGDAAVLELTAKFDNVKADALADLEVSKQARQQALESLAPELRASLETAANRIRAYAEHQKMASWQIEEADGTVLGQKIDPLDRAGLYVPGGKATYPSSVLMNAIPAKVAGVGELIMVVPAPNGELNPMVLAAAEISGVDCVFTIGGAQAVAALAYGTETIPAVDKITGPGNIFVATAKRQVFGKVGIDMIAGPSEILVVCDGKTPAEWIAADLFSQAEHDENAQSILICDDDAYLDAVAHACNKLVKAMPRAEIIQASMENRGAMILVKDMDEAVEIANRIAPEHLELSVENPEAMAEKIRHAGAIFMGRYTAEALGDYCAGPNHVLPTSGTARYSSPLGVYDFQKRSSIINCSKAGASTLGKVADTLALAESLPAHALSARLRATDD